MLLKGIVSRQSVVVGSRLSFSSFLVGCIHVWSCRREEVVKRLVLGLGGDLLNRVGCLGGLCAHVGTVGETTELCQVLACILVMVDA